MKKIFHLLLFLILISACSDTQKSRSSPTIPAIQKTATSPVSIHPPSLTPPMTPTNSISANSLESVTFTTVDGIKLAGTLFGRGEPAVILTHQGTYGADQETWHPFARQLADRGYSALAFDFRGVGKSEGRLGYGELAMDVNAAVQFLQSRGYEKIVCVGASMGGTACIRAAQDYPFIGFIILSSTMRAGFGGDSLLLTSADLEKLTPPKLFICAERDYPSVVNDTKLMAESSPDLKSLLLLPGPQHGTDLFNTDSGQQLTTSMLGFLDDLKEQTLIPASPTGATAMIPAQISSTPADTTFPLPRLQVITAANAGEMQLLETLQIPGFKKGSLSQCSVAFSPDNRLLAGACGKNQVAVWNLQTGSLAYQLYDPNVQIVACAFSPDGKQIACGGFDEAVTLWDAFTGSKIADFKGYTAPIWDIAFDPAGKSLAACSLGLLGGGAERGDVHLWETLVAQPRWVFSGIRDFLSLSFHPAGKAIAYGSIGGNVGILDAESGELLFELSDPGDNTGSVAYSRSGLWLAAGSDDRHIYLWDAKDYELAARLSGHNGYVNGVAFSPDENLLASGSHDKTVGVWDLKDQKMILQLKGHEREVLRVAFNPDGTLIASISWDGTVRLWGIPR